MCLTNEMRTCFLGIPQVKKIPRHDLDLDPQIELYFPPCQESDQEEEDAFQPRKKKQTNQFSSLIGSGNTFTYISAFKPSDDPKELSDAKERNYLFQDLEVFDDISKGQRGYNRNIDRLSNQLIQYYKKNYPRDAEQTLFQI